MTKMGMGASRFLDPIDRVSEILFGLITVGSGFLMVMIGAAMVAVTIALGG